MAVIAVAVPLGVDATVARLSAGALFLLSAAITAIGLFLFLPPQRRSGRMTRRTRVVTGGLGALFVIATTISVIALHGFAAIALTTASLVPLALAYVALRRDAG